MDVSAVQRGRDRIGSRTRTKEELSPSAANSMSPFKSEIEKEAIAIPGSSSSLFIPSPSSAFIAVAQTNSTTPLLDEMLRGYRRYSAMRRTTSGISINGQGSIQKMLEEGTVCCYRK